MGEWAVENTMKINPGKGKAVSFTGALIKVSLNYLLVDERIPQASSCEYLGIILLSNLNWADQFYYTVKKHVMHYVL
jgi:hypothetical protein